MKLSIRNSAVALLAVSGLLLAITGCQTPPKAPVEPAAPVTTGTDQTARMFDRGSPTSYSWMGFPQTATRPEDAYFLIEREVPTEVRPNDNVSFTVNLTNQSTFTVDQVIHEEALSASMEFVNAEPFPEQRDGKLVWTFDSFAPGQNETIRIEGKSIRTGSLRYTGDTRLAFGMGSLQLATNAILPELSMGASNPAVALINEPIPVSLNVRNSGTAPVLGAKIVHTFPKGLLTEDGKSRVEFDLGDFNPGQVKAIDFALKGVETGSYETEIRATAKDGINATATLTTSVVKPELLITASAPKLRYVGNVISYQIEVKNVGDGVANETQIVQTLADGTSLASADQGGTAEGRTVVWNIGTLNPGQSKIVSTRAVGERIMIARSTATANARAADAVQAVMVTDVEGIEALLVDAYDANDPCPVGEEIFYTIEVTNQGSLEATGITLVAELTPEMEFVESKGATKSRVEGNKLVFEALPALSPAGKATWDVTIKAIKDGNVRFRVEVISDQLSRPVSDEEPSTFYY